MKTEQETPSLSSSRQASSWGGPIGTVFPPLKQLFYDLQVMRSGARIVDVSKALHFLSSDLFMAIDRSYTLNFFYLGGGYSQNTETEFKYYKEIFEEHVKVTQDLGLTHKDVDYVGWNTLIPKMIDNALIVIAIGVDRRVTAGNGMDR